MIDRKSCKGCYNDINNTENRRCFFANKCTLVYKNLIHVNARPPFEDNVDYYPDCYDKPDHVMLDVKESGVDL